MPDTSLSTLDPLSKPMGFRFVSLDELTQEQKQVLKDSVAKDTTDTELTYFLNVALAQELDPFRKEVWCIKFGGRLTVQTGRDGFLKIAKRDQTFDRIQSAEVREGDEFRMDPISGQIEHRFTAKRGQIVGAWAMITRKDGVKIPKYVTFSEYCDPSSNMWRDYPTAMITKCVESVLCKQFANVTGIVAEETMKKDGSIIDSSPAAQEQQSSLKDRLIAEINACKSVKDFEVLRDRIAGSVGKLFGDEREAVYAAAKAKKAELEGLDVTETKRPTIIEKATVESVSLTPDGRAEVNLTDVQSREMTDEEIASVKPTEPQQTSDLPQESHANPTGMPERDFDSWLEGMKAQETQEGIDDVYNQVLTKPLSPDQRAALDQLRDTCKKQLEKPKAKKKATPPST